MEDEEEIKIPNVEQVEQAYSEEQQDFGDHVSEQQEEQQFGTYPDQIPKDSIFTLFKHIIGIKDSSKVANLDKRELGMLDLSVRNCEYLAKLGYQLHNQSFDKFFMSKAEITLSTSMSKKGWLPELIVSQKKFSQRTVQPMMAQAAAKKGFLGMGKQEPQTQ